MRVAEALRSMRDALDSDRALVEVVVTASSLPVVPLGERMLVFVHSVDGSLGNAVIDQGATERARELLVAGRASRMTIGTEDGEVTLYLAPHRPSAPLVIVGAGHIARPLCSLGAMLGYRVTVLDDRPDFATSERFPEAERVLRVSSDDPLGGVELNERTRLVLVTRGHKYDFEVLRIALRVPLPPGYIGMVGSKRRVRAAFEQLVGEGVSPELLRRVHAPIGLDIGAETPEEIAVAIAAELVRLRRGGSGSSLSENARVVDRWIRSAS